MGHFWVTFGSLNSFWVSVGLGARPLLSSRVERGAGLLRRRMRMLILEVVIGALSPPCNFRVDPLEKYHCGRSHYIIHSKPIVQCKNNLGGHFGPEKKYLAPPPSPQTFPRRPSPSRASSSETPPFPLFLLKPAPPATSSEASSFPPPQNRKKKSETSTE